MTLLLSLQYLTVTLAGAVTYTVKNLDTGEEFTSIQSAINDTDTDNGDTIFVKQGNTFEENLIINKELTIRSDNKWGTTIVTQGAYQGVDIVANNVTLEGFKILLDEVNQGTAWHLKISGQNNVVLRDIVMYGPGKNSGYVGNNPVNPGITGIDINSSQNVLLDRVTVEKYNKNGIAVTAKQSSGSTASENITFKDIITRNNGKSDGWAGLAFYTTSSSYVVSNINGVDFQGNNLVAWNPMGIFFEGALGGNTLGNSSVNVSSVSFLNNKVAAIVNGQSADVEAIGSTFNGNSGVNTTPENLDIIEAGIVHNCDDSPYLSGICNIEDSYLITALPIAGSVEYASDDQGPVVTDIILNGQNVNLSNVRSNNCEAIKNFYYINGNVDLSATIQDVTSNVANAKYKVRKVNSNGCTLSNIFSSGFVNMTKISGDSWEDLAGFDTNNAAGDGEYTIMLQTADNLGNVNTRYIDIVIDNTAPILTMQKSVNGLTVTGDVHVRSRVSNVGPGEPPVKRETYIDGVLFKTINNDSRNDEIKFNTTDTGSAVFPALNLADGLHEIKVVATDLAGNSSTVIETFTVDNTPPTPFTLSAIISNEETSRIISGTTEPGTTVFVEVNSDPKSGFALVDLAGNWSISFNGFAVGTHTVKATATDSVGNTIIETTTFEVTPSAVAGVNTNNPTGSGNNSNVVPVKNEPIGGGSNTNEGNNIVVAQNTAPATTRVNVQGESTETSTDEDFDLQQSEVLQSNTTQSDIEENPATDVEEDDSSNNWWLWLIIIFIIVVVGYSLYRANKKSEA